VTGRASVKDEKKIYRRDVHVPPTGHRSRLNAKWLKWPKWHRHRPSDRPPSRETSAGGGHKHARSQNTFREGDSVRERWYQAVRELRSRRGDNAWDCRRRKRVMRHNVRAPGVTPPSRSGRWATCVFSLTLFPSYPFPPRWCPLSNAAAVVRWFLFPGFEYRWGAFDLSQRRRRR
jgi:hypothetical protein